jgi:hypothetical protein
MPLIKYIVLLTALLVFSAFFERYCFAIVVFKTKNYGAILIVLIAFFNAVFLRLIQNLRVTKHKKRLHEMYKIEDAPQVGGCAIFCIG